MSVAQNAVFTPDQNNKIKIIIKLLVLQMLNNKQSITEINEQANKRRRKKWMETLREIEKLQCLSTVCEKLKSIDCWWACGCVCVGAYWMRWTSRLEAIRQHHNDCCSVLCLALTIPSPLLRTESRRRSRRKGFLVEQSFAWCKTKGSDKFSLWVWVDSCNKVQSWLLFRFQGNS